MGKPHLLMGGILTLIFLIIVPATAQFQASSESLTGFNATLPGERNIGQLYTWSIQNVSGTADVIYHYTVYASRLIGGNYTYHSREWNTWEKRYAAAGSQYLIVWIKGWLDPVSGTTWIGWAPERFNAWVWGNRTIKPEPVQMEDMPIAWKSERYRPVMIAEAGNRTMPDGTILTTEWYSWELWNQRIRMEPGNPWDGFVLYQVPVEATLDDIQIGGWFGYYGTAWWNLKDRFVEQVDSIENQRIQQQNAIVDEIRKGIRLSDRPRDRARA